MHFSDILQPEKSGYFHRTRLLPVPNEGPQGVRYNES